MSATAGVSYDLYCPICERHYASGERCPEDGNRLVRLDGRDPMFGRVLDGRFTLVAKLGVGGMGSVYRATQQSGQRDVAIKLMASNIVSDPQAIKRFLREAKLASQLAHPNAVSVLEFGQTDDGLFYIVMELLEGRSLQDLLEADPVLSVARVARIAMQVCEALDGAHRLQIVHRDLKPANIMLLAGGHDLVKVLDFGIAKSLAMDDTKMTQTGSTMGTPAFMAPEIATGGEFDTRADLYSLGCVLYLMLTGNLPFVAATPGELMLMHRDRPPAPMYGVPDAVSAVVMRLLAKQPAQRFASAAATRDALAAALAAIGPGRAASSPVAQAEDPTGFGAPLPPAMPAAGWASGGVTIAPPAVAPPPPVRAIAPPRRRARVIVVTAVAAIVVGAVLAVTTRHSSGRKPAAGSDIEIIAVTIDAAVPQVPPADAPAMLAPPPDAAEPEPAGHGSGSSVDAHPHHHHHSAPRPTDDEAPPF